MHAEAADLATAGYPDAACGSPEFVLTSVRALATPSRVMLATHVARATGRVQDSLSAEERSSGSRSSSSWSEIRRLVACCVIKIKKYIPQARPAANPTIPIHPVWNFRSSHIPPKPGPTMTSEAAKIRPVQRAASASGGSGLGALAMGLSSHSQLVPPTLTLQPVRASRMAPSRLLPNTPGVEAWRIRIGRH